MSRFAYLMRLFVIAGLVLSGAFLSAGLTYAFLVSTGMSWEDVVQLDQDNLNNLPAASLRVLLAIQHIGAFILPGILFAWLTYQSKLWEGVDLHRFPKATTALLGIFFLAAAYPMVTLSYNLNEAIPLPSWVSELENQAQDTLYRILENKSPFVLMINLILISIMPGIGEELVFRGIFQKNIAGLFRNPYAGIWIAAFLFSAFHLQFEGFFPRMVLGASLGYLYYWTQNLWVPVIVHAFNNGIQIIVMYAMNIDLTEVETEGSDKLQPWMIIMSVAAMFFIFTLIKKNQAKLDQR